MRIAADAIDRANRGPALQKRKRPRVAAGFVRVRALARTDSTVQKLAANAPTTVWS